MVLLYSSTCPLTDPRLALRSPARRHRPQLGRARARGAPGQGARGSLTPLNQLLTHIPVTQDWLLDGFPRKASQAVLLDQLLGKFDDELNFVVSLDVPDQVILKRIEGTSPSVVASCDLG